MLWSDPSVSNASYVAPTTVLYLTELIIGFLIKALACFVLQKDFCGVPTSEVNAIICLIQN